MPTRRLKRKTLAVLTAFCMVFTLFSGVAMGHEEGTEGEIELSQDYYPFFADEGGTKVFSDDYEITVTADHEDEGEELDDVTDEDDVHLAVYNESEGDVKDEVYEDIGDIAVEEFEVDVSMDDFDINDEDDLPGNSGDIDDDYSIVFVSDSSSPSSGDIHEEFGRTAIEFVAAGDEYSIDLPKDEVIAHIEDYADMFDWTADVDEEIIEQAQEWAFVPANLEDDGDIGENDRLGFADSPATVDQAVYSDNGLDAYEDAGDEEVDFVFDEEDLQVANKYVAAFQIDSEDSDTWVVLPDVDDDDDIIYEDSYFEYRYDVEDLDYDLPEIGETFRVSGDLVDAGGNAVETGDDDNDRSGDGLQHGDMVLLRGDDGDDEDERGTRRDGSFDLADYVTTTDDYHIAVDRGTESDGFFVYETIEGDVRDLDIDASPDNFIYDLHEVGVEVNIEIDAEYDGDSVVDGDEWCEDALDDIADVGDIDDNDWYIEFEDDDGDDQTIEGSDDDLKKEDDVIKWNVAGNDYEFEEDKSITVELVIEGESDDDETVSYEGEVDMDVEEPEDINLVGLDEEIEVNDFWEDGVLDGVFVLNDELDEFDEITELYIQGAGIDIDLDEDDDFADEGVYYGEDEGPDEDLGEGELLIDGDYLPEQTGEIEFFIEVENDDTEDYETTIEVDGYAVDFEETEFLVDEEHDFTITLEDAQGRAMNNAAVSLVSEDEELTEGDLGDPERMTEEDEHYVCSSDEDIFGGEYVFEDFEHDTVEDMQVVVERDDEVKSYFEDGVSVIGEEIYEIEVEEEGLVYGIDQEINFTVLEDGDEADDIDFVEVDIDDGRYVLCLDDYEDEEPGIEQDNGEFIVTIEDEAVPRDTDYDIEITVAEDDEEKEIGEAVVEVELPEMNIETVKTDRFEYEYDLELTNPITEEEIEVDNVEFAPEEDDIYVRDLDEDYFEEGGEAVDFDDGEVELAVAIDDEEFDYDEDDPILNMSVTMDEEVEDMVEIEILEPQVSFTPEEIVRGVETFIEIEYLDAAGNSLEGYDVTFVQDEVTIETAEEGMVEFDVDARTSVLNFEFEADLDEIEYEDNGNDTETIELDPFEKRVRTVRDAEGPEISYPEVVEEDTAELTIEDPSGVEQTFINGEMAFPPENPTVDLEDGENVFNVYTTDGVGNSTAEQVVITYEAPYTEATTGIGDDSITIGDETVNFDPGVSPFIEGDRTFLPLRTIMEAFGGDVTWDNQDKSATIEIDDRTIVYYMDDVSYLVDGEERMMDVEPYLDEETDRIYIPLRFFLEDALDADVTWHPDTQEIDIVY